MTQAPTPGNTQPKSFTKEEEESEALCYEAMIREVLGLVCFFGGFYSALWLAEIVDTVWKVVVEPSWHPRPSKVLPGELRRELVHKDLCSLSTHRSLLYMIEW